MTPYTVCEKCGNPKPVGDASCEYCASGIESPVSDAGHGSATALLKKRKNSLTTWPSVAILTFPIWGIALFGWIANRTGLPGVLNIGVVLALFSSLPIVRSTSHSGLGKFFLFVGYYWFAVPVAIITILAFVGRA